MSGFGQSTLRLLLLALLALLSPPVAAQSCTVPGSHLTIRAAIDDPACATIALAAQTYTESLEVPRSLTLAGPGSGGAVVQGLVLAMGSGTQVTLQGLRVENGCTPNALRSVDGAKIAGSNLQVERSMALPCPLTPLTIFEDGFESGDTSAWSATAP